MQTPPAPLSQLRRSQHWLVLIAFIGALTAAFLQRPRSEPTGFVVVQSPPRANAQAFFQARMLPGAGSAAASPSLVGLPDGSVGIAWQGIAGGKYAQDTLWFSRLSNGQWQDPLPISSVEDSAGALFAHISRLGAPVLQAASDRLHLWFGADGVGGSSRLLLHSVSNDGGTHWRPPAAVTVSPLAACAPLTGHPPLLLADGGFALPIGQSGCLSRHGEWLRFDARGRLVDKQRLPGAGSHPTAIASSARQALVLLTDAGGLRALRSDDDGTSWQEIARPAIATPGTPIALLRLASGRLLLAANRGQGRGTLGLWLGQADGTGWQLARLVENAADAAADFSEPALLQTADGSIHLAYAWRRQGIRHLSFNEAWLDEGAP